MCLIFVSVKSHPTYKLIVAANRDEFYNRKTAAASFWEDQPSVLGGRDLEAGGTWLGVSRSGRVSMITNYRDPKNIDPAAPSRGHLVSEYLRSDSPPSAYLENLQPNASRYNGFNLLVGNSEEMWYLSNYKNGIEKLNDGLHGLSNHLLNTPWPKVVRGKKQMLDVTSRKFTAQELFEVLYNDEIAPDDLLPDTGVGIERERYLSSMFIKSPGYGTRCSSVILINNDNEVFFAERVYDLATFRFEEKSFMFKTT